MAHAQGMYTLIVALVIVAANICSTSSYQYDGKKIKAKTDIMLMKILKEYDADLPNLQSSFQQANTQQSLDVFMQSLKKNNDSLCSCQNYTCGCCVHLEVEKISLNDTGCVNISYLPDEYGFEFEFILNGNVLIREKISVKNPPPICAAIPYIHNLASLCIRFYDLEFQNKQFSGCSDIEVKLEGVIIRKFDLGCFHIPPSMYGRSGRVGIDNRTPGRERVQFSFQDVMLKSAHSFTAQDRDVGQLMFKDTQGFLVDE